MPQRIRLIVVPFIAGTMVALTTAAAWAFSQQTLPAGNYDFNYGSLNDKDKSNKSWDKSDPNSPGLHFSIQGGQRSPSGFRSFGSDNSPGPPDFSRPVGNGN